MNESMSLRYEPTSESLQISGLEGYVISNHGSGFRVSEFRVLFQIGVCENAASVLGLGCRV